MLGQDHAECIYVYPRFKLFWTYISVSLVTTYRVSSHVMNQNKLAVNPSLSSIFFTFLLWLSNHDQQVLCYLAFLYRPFLLRGARILDSHILHVCKDSNPKFFVGENNCFKPLQCIICLLSCI